jgi:probable addiction module antidote protein/putative addiction module killer protein
MANPINKVIEEPFSHAGDMEPVGQGSSELRIHFGPGYRIYFHKRGKTIIVRCAVAIKAPRQKTSRQPSDWLRNGGSEMVKILTSYDPAEDLTTDEAMATFMAAAFETNDAGYIAHALGVVARAKGMAQIAGQTGLSREQLYRSFSENGNPTLKTTLAVMKALGIELTAKVHV